MSSTLFTGPGQGNAVPVQTGTMLEVDLEVTAQTSITAFSAYLEASNDGVNWWEVPFDITYKNAGNVAAEGSGARTNNRNIVNNETTSGVVAKYTAIYKHLPAAQIRIRHFFSGTNITYKARGAIK